MRLTFNSIGWGVIGTLFLMTPLFASSARHEAKTGSAPAYNWAHTEEASGLLRQIRSLSARAAEDAHLLSLSSKGNQLHWRTHAHQLAQIRGHINTMGKKLHRLQEIQSTIAPWQQDALARVTPKAVALAVHADEAIAYLNEWQGKLWAPAYTDHMSAVSDHAEGIKSSVSAFLDYARTSDKLKELEQQIEYTGA